MAYILKTNFTFSAQAIKWITHKFDYLSSRSFEHDLYNFINPDVIKISPVGLEISKFLADLGIKFKRISTFVSNSSDHFIGNPHIDFNNDLKEIPSRFNVIIKGNPADKMVWWNFNIDLQTTSFKTLDNIEYNSFAVPGNNPEERWQYLGEPTYQIELPQQAGYFVRTNCIHTISVSPGSRLVVTVELDIDLDDVDKKIK